MMKNDNKGVETQYRTAENLNARISVHEKYSTNPQPFGEWVVSQYEIEPGYRILELGCGTGSMWQGNLSLLDGGAYLTLTDFSSGMLEEARNNVGESPKADFCQVDIQNIPYVDSTFDMVIANMMLYHVPDLDRALSEVRRVLKPGGSFYCATYGEHGIMEFICDAMGDHAVYNSMNKSFTLQNGGETLGKYFSMVEKRTREDGLAITHMADFVAYIQSLSSLSGVENISGEDILYALERKSTEGILYVPKEYGMFICR